MNRIKGIIILLFTTIFVFILASCSNGNYSYEKAYDGEYYFVKSNLSIEQRTVITSKVVIPYTNHYSPVIGISNYAFKDYISVKEFVLPSRLERIGEGAFRNCRSVKEFDLPDTVKYIDICAFAECTSLEKISIPKGITYIGYQTFYGCNNLKSVVFNGNKNEWVNVFKYSLKDTIISCLDGDYYYLDDTYNSLVLVGE